MSKSKAAALKVKEADTAVQREEEMMKLTKAKC
jgi:hypothetical protein